MNTQFDFNNNLIFNIIDYDNFLCQSLSNINNTSDAKILIKEKFSTSIISENDFFTCSHKFGFIMLFNLDESFFAEKISTKLKNLKLKSRLITFNSFFILIWEDYEEEINYLDCKTLCNFFMDISAFKEFIFRKLTLNDIYYSKISKKFYVKNFTKFILTNNLNISFNELYYNPKSILHGITPHKYLNDSFDYEKAQKYQLSNNYYNNSFGGFQ